MAGGNKLRATAWVLFCLCLSSGCTKAALRVERPIRSAAVIPFLVKAHGREGKGLVEDPISGRFFVAGEIAPNAQRELTDLLYKKMAAFPRLQLAPRMEIQRATKPGDFAKDSVASALKVGEAFGVEGVVLGWVFRYQERIGSAIAVERPASVSFAIHLVGGKEGRILWSGPFQETQQALSENVLRLGAFLRRRGTWLTARNLAGVGMDEVLVSFPASRERPEHEGP
jgi:hypothetical protein